MRGRDKQKYQHLDAALHYFHTFKHPLPGIQSRPEREALLEQILESVHRVDYIRTIIKRDVSPRRLEPNDEMFDPIKAAITQKRIGNIDEAFWLVFLSVHFGKHLIDGWRLVQDIYSGLGQQRWNWKQTAASPTAFRRWLDSNQSILKSRKRHFGNHRKYESLDARKTRGTGAAIQSYIDWVDPRRGHTRMIDDCQQVVGNDPGDLFDYLYRSMKTVVTFGRTARFDYLTMAGKLELAPIEPNSAYLEGATGPLRGGNLLLGGSTTAGMQAKAVDLILRQLDETLNVGMQVLEDSLCNWQKNPSKFTPFRG